jgi:hypothetical protein
MTLMDSERITLSLDDHTEGAHMSPDRVRIGDLVRFAEDVKVFLQGDGKELDAQSLEVSVVRGSFALQTAPIAYAPKLFSDLKALQDGFPLDQIDKSRRLVLERWQKSARSASGLVYKISAPFLTRPLVVNADSDFQPDDIDHWVWVERYISGEIQDLGGATRPNAHVRMPDGKTLKVLTDKDLLRNDKLNRLYKTVMLRIKAEYNLQTRELRNARLIEFVEYADEVNEGDLARMKERGKLAWKDVKDPAAWVNELRGVDH